MQRRATKCILAGNRCRSKKLTDLIPSHRRRGAALFTSFRHGQSSDVEKWKRQREDFRNVLKVSKAEADSRVERSLYERATGYSYNAVKIFMPYGAKEPIYAHCIEHVPPDVTAAILWLKNRKPAERRDAWQLERVTGKYVIADRPLSEEDWIRERGAEVIEGEATAVTPAIGDTAGTR